MKAFVSGATGFIGSAIVRQLVNDGCQVRALVRADSNPGNLAGFDLELWRGDLLDPDSLYTGLKGCDILYHAAADYRLWSARPAEMYLTNVTGTKNILDAALKNGTERVVYTSSVGTLGINTVSSCGDEETPVTFNDMVGPYKKSKFLAEREAEKFLPLGLPLVIVNPSTPVGPFDIKPTPTGKIVLDFIRGRMPAYLDTGLNIIDVDDCARGHILAGQLGKIGRRYILGNVNLSLREIFEMLEKITGIPAPKVRLPYLPVLAAAYVNEAFAFLSKREPLIPLAGVRMAGKHMYFDSSRAVRELGLPQNPVYAPLERAVVWFRANGYV